MNLLAIIIGMGAFFAGTVVIGLYAVWRVRRDAYAEFVARRAHNQHSKLPGDRGGVDAVEGGATGRCAESTAPQHLAPFKRG